MTREAIIMTIFLKMQFRVISAILPISVAIALSSEISYAEGTAKNTVEAQEKTVDDHNKSNDGKIDSKNGNLEVNKISHHVSAAYYSDLYRILSGNVQYPQSAALAGKEGDCRVRVVFDRTGAFQEFKLTKKSGIQSLDQACLHAVEMTYKFPPVPTDEQLDESYFVVELPINFVLRK